MFANFRWKSAVIRAIEVFLAALLGAGGMYLSSTDGGDPSVVTQTWLALGPVVLG